MPKNPLKRAVAVNLLPDDYAALHAEAQIREWSDKKMAEKVIIWYLKNKDSIDLNQSLRPTDTKGGIKK